MFTWRRCSIALFILLVIALCMPVGARSPILWKLIGTVLQPADDSWSVAIGTTSGVTTEEVVYRQYALDAAENTVETVRFTVQMTDNTEGSVDAVFRIYQKVNGALVEVFEGTPP